MKQDKLYGPAAAVPAMLVSSQQRETQECVTINPKMEIIGAIATLVILVIAIIILTTKD